MRINSIRISNLFSFDDTTIFFGKHNVITGHNDAGKSNLIRILKRMVHDHGYGFSVSYVEDYEKFNKKINSWVVLSLSFSEEEFELISKFIFGKCIKNCIKIDFIILWEDSHNNRQNIKTALILQDRLIVWNHDKASDRIGIINENKPTPEELFNILEKFKRISIGQQISEDKYLANVLTNDTFIDLLISQPSTIYESNFNTKNNFDIFIRNNKSIDKDIFDYCKVNYTSGNVDLWILLVKIMSKNLLFLEEFRPPIEELKSMINEKKSSSSTSYITNLQREFSNIFPDYTFDIESNDEINFIVGKVNEQGSMIKDQTFKLENSASGFFEVLYMLNKLQSDNENIIILDEPALHLHPIKQQHFWQTLVEKINNQVIVITHSPYLVNLSLFKGNNKLINIQRKNKKSQIYPKTENQISSIKVKDYNFKPEIFFSKCNIFVEGPGDEAAIAAISDTLGSVFEKYSIQLINVGGKDVLEAYVPILKEYEIPHVALTDYDYNCDDEKNFLKSRNKTNDFLVLEQRLEEELYEFDTSVNTMKTFDVSNPCNTSKDDQPKSIRPMRAYNIMQKAMLEDKKKVKESVLGDVVSRSLIKSGVNPDIIWKVR